MAEEEGDGQTATADPDGDTQPEGEGGQEPSGASDDGLLEGETSGDGTLPGEESSEPSEGGKEPGDGTPLAELQESTPDQFWTEDGEVNDTEVVKSLMNMDRKLEGDVSELFDEDGNLKRSEALDTWLETRRSMSDGEDGEEDDEAEPTEEMEGDVPDDPEDYEYEPLEDSLAEYPADDPAVMLSKEVAHESGLTQDQYNSFVNSFINKAIETGLTPQGQRDKEMKKLASDPNHAQAMIDSINSRLQGYVNQEIITEDQMQSFQRDIQSAESLKAFARIMQGMGDDGIIPSDVTVESAQDTEAEVMEMMNDPRYHQWNDEFDPAYRKKVQEKVNELAGE